MLFFPAAQTSIIITKKLARKRKCVIKHNDYFIELQIQSNIGILYFFKKIDSYSLTADL